MGESGDEDRAVSIVAMEAGSRWPMWLDDVRLGSPQLVTVVQHSDQPLATLVSRALHVVAEAKSHDRRIEIMAIACNERSDRNAIIARAQLAKAVMPSMSATGGGRIVLTADERAPQASRNVMLSLARSLADNVPDKMISVGVSFGQYRSGLWPTTPRSELEEEARRANTGFRVRRRHRIASGEE